ncbi:MAG TPA: hypothetical protein VN578_18360 [Candidatus Binatia bacterium]|jgi:hypothetical protein|nr:hypothetical protein [Candidatus Binatia bacterium]
MTHKILQSDIDLARKQLESKRPETEIVTALTRRGIEPAKAILLVHELRCGRRVVPEIDRLPRIVPGPSSEAPQALSASGVAPLTEPAKTSRAPDAVAQPKRGRKSAGRPWIWALVFLTTVGGLAIAYSFYGSRSRTRAQASGLTQIAEASSQPDKMRLAAPGPELELRRDGLYLGGDLVGRTNARSVLGTVLGPATRTNQVERPSKIIYAYDREGLLVYSKPGGGDENIVFDFDALGGTHGTERPFTGSLRVEEAMIRGDTDAGRLRAIKPLGLSPSEPDGCIFASHYSTVELVFTYRKGLQRLSSIEIDLK